MLLTLATAPDLPPAAGLFLRVITWVDLSVMSTHFGWIQVCKMFVVVISHSCTLFAFSELVKLVVIAHFQLSLF